ncbi:MAG: 30S ribosomal protein S17 [Candidatus Kerfeldbacteria bacterium]|nr:30S ribosomal protein S17 [Candidatus Kerfeldbacteria bacterium]
MSETSTTKQPAVQAQHRRFSGIVVSDKGDKTLVVAVERTLRHKLYGKLYKRTRRFHVHDEKNQYTVKDVVEFVECRPISKLKRWRVLYKNEQE